MIPFTKPTRTGNEERHVNEVLRGGRMCGDGPFSDRCHNWFESVLGCERALLTASCTQALELAALLAGIGPGDEVIMPSYTFVSTANAFVLRGATVVFVDIRPDTLNLDETRVEAAVTERTKAIVPVHYAGVACDMDYIVDLASWYGLYVIEDAAQGMCSRLGRRPLGTIGHLGVYSFHETKNFTSGGEGGLLIVNDERFAERAEILREKGTNRRQFIRGAVDKYSWVSVGGSYLLSDLQAAYLWGQVEMVDTVNDARLEAWNIYADGLSALVEDGLVAYPQVPDECVHNGHIFYLKCANRTERDALISALKERGVEASFHYVPLHSAPAGSSYGRFNGKDSYTTRESGRIVRLPLWFGIRPADQMKVMDAIRAFYIG